MSESTTAHDPAIKILFLCTGNSCRSQMAEGWTRALHGERFEAYSAGIYAKGLNAKAVAVMEEAGVDLSGQTSDSLEDLAHVQPDVVITVCGHADENCPVFPGAVIKQHVPFDDPPQLEESAKSKEEALAHYRRVRDEIRAFVTSLPQLARKWDLAQESAGSAASE